jgi:hypothetical protein
VSRPNYRQPGNIPLSIGREGLRVDAPSCRINPSPRYGYSPIDFLIVGDFLDAKWLLGISGVTLDYEHDSDPDLNQIACL